MPTVVSTSVDTVFTLSLVLVSKSRLASTKAASLLKFSNENSSSQSPWLDDFNNSSVTNGISKLSGELGKLCDFSEHDCVGSIDSDSAELDAAGSCSK